MRELTLKTQAEILAEIEALVVDTSNNLWTDANIYAALNNAIQGWGNRVFLPRLYSLTGGLAGGTYEYTLPSYIRTPLEVQAAITRLTDDQENELYWITLTGWTLEPAADGTHKLRIYLSYDTEDSTTDCRILWWAENGPVPTTVPTLSGTLAADGTSLTTSAAVASTIPDVGWVKIDGEWMSYSGVSRGASSTTLSNLVRGLYGTTAASHSSTPSIYWGVAVDDTRLWEQLSDAIVARLHYQQIHRGTQDDRSNHERIMGYAQDRADAFWRRTGYVAQFRPKFLLHRSVW